MDRFKQKHDQYLEVPKEEILEDEEELDAKADAELEERMIDMDG